MSLRWGNVLCMFGSWWMVKAIFSAAATHSLLSCFLCTIRNHFLESFEQWIIGNVQLRGVIFELSRFSPLRRTTTWFLHQGLFSSLVLCFDFLFKGCNANTMSGPSKSLLRARETRSTCAGESAGLWIACLTDSPTERLFNQDPGCRHGDMSIGLAQISVAWQWIGKMLIYLSTKTSYDFLQQGVLTETICSTLDCIATPKNL